jgi:hypothetical protein
MVMDGTRRDGVGGRGPGFTRSTKGNREGEDLPAKAAAPRDCALAVH